MSKGQRASKYINLEVLNDLNSPYARRRFFTFFLLLSGASAAAHFSPEYLSLNDSISTFIKSVSANIFSATLVIILVYGAYILFIGEDFERPEVETIRPGDINGEIRKLPKDTAFYYLWGRSATYFRSETLRELNEFSIKTRKTVTVCVLLPDPCIPELASAYEDMMASLGEDRDQDKLLKNAVATCAACAIYTANNSNLRIQVFFSKFLPAYRIDMSEGGAMLTEDDKSLYGLKFSRKSQFFEMFRTMLLNEIEISREAALAAKNWKSFRIDSEDIPIDLLFDFGFDGDKIRLHRDEIFQLMAKTDHRYK
ncbi:hypothetical protein [Leisingera sp. F5]|uniref:hypothetical protein n=1 Tax=Leisingera sp. F5 TaxID=1813816 RepID=UPI000B162113|nr:hypothetical protein [Leisingera sp. F5]